MTEMMLLNILENLNSRFEYYFSIELDFMDNDDGKRVFSTMLRVFDSNNYFIAEHNWEGNNWPEALGKMNEEINKSDYDPVKR